MNVSYTGNIKIKRPGGLGQTYLVTLEAQEITPLRIFIVAEDTEYDREVPGIHLVLLVVRRHAVEM